MDNATSAVKSAIGTQPKMWKDLSADEKIERMRQEIKMLSQNIGGANRQTEVLASDFKGHDHGKDGRVMLSIIEFGAQSEIGSSLKPTSEADAKGEVYF